MTARRELHLSLMEDPATCRPRLTTLSVAEVDPATGDRVERVLDDDEAQRLARAFTMAVQDYAIHKTTIDIDAICREAGL